MVIVRREGWSRLAVIEWMDIELGSDEHRLTGNAGDQVAFWQVSLSWDLEGSHIFGIRAMVTPKIRKCPCQKRNKYIPNASALSKLYLSMSNVADRVHLITNIGPYCLHTVQPTMSSQLSPIPVLYITKVNLTNVV